MLTADDLLTKKFPATKFRLGYDVVEVDTFLDRVLGTLKRYESGAPQGDRVLAGDVRATKFSASKFRQGYDVVAVDAYLDDIEQTLVGLEKGPAPR